MLCARMLLHCSIQQPGPGLHVYLIHVLQCTYIITMIRQGSQRAVCMWDKYNMDIVQNNFIDFYCVSPCPVCPQKPSKQEQNQEK